MTGREELVLWRERYRNLQIESELAFKEYKRLFDYFNERYPDEVTKYLEGKNE